MGDAATILFCGDVVGSPGRHALKRLLPALVERHRPTFIVVNGENAAGGLGITPKIADELLSWGVHAITLGNHAYKHREILPYLDREPRLIRPANYNRAHPGKGTVVVESDGLRLGVVNLSGNVFLQAARPLLSEADAAVTELERQGVDHILVDVHAEATSEKVALGWHLDGRVTAVVGTHTHVPTADARVLPGGTAYISDAGMTGSRAGVIGVKREQALEAFLTQMPVRFETAEEDVWVMGAIVEIGPNGLAESIEQVLVPAGD
jgi:metallophosphoesterase (TIGR00282 family)